ncbi:MAG: hypothetical protein BWY83_02259 [bacterium ADurb.Bin478]|nr:MAG: hypothetical protein BWY83_02259 [bacterium ADurb.Bin478]
MTKVQGLAITVHQGDQFVDLRGMILAGEIKAVFVIVGQMKGCGHAFQLAAEVIGVGEAAAVELDKGDAHGPHGGDDQRGGQPLEWLYGITDERVFLQCSAFDRLIREYRLGQEGLQDHEQPVKQQDGR